jgi:heavy metal sensor kinase
MKLTIRTRMTVWYAALLSAVLVAVGVFVVVQLRADLTGQLDGALGPAAAQVAVDYRREGDRELVDSAGTVLKGERATAQLLSPAGSVLVRFGDAVSARPLLTPAARRSVLRGRPQALTARVGGTGFRLAARRVRRQGADAIVVVGQSLGPVARSVGGVVELLLLAGPAALLATALGGWLLARRALAPIGAMTRAAAAIGPERLAERVRQPGSDDEVAHLARTLNAMLDRVQEGGEQQQRLVADASHELKSPLAAMRTEIDVSLRADEHLPGSAATLRSAREEVDRLTRIVDDLLVLAAHDEGSRAVHEDVDLAELVTDVVRGFACLAGERGIELVDRVEPVVVAGDRDGLRRAVSNVVVNALDFSPPGGLVTVAVHRAGETVRIVVDDAGPGVAAAQREHVFERFARIDGSRTRSTGGSGLGLAIVRALLTAHGGDAHIEASPSGGTRVVLALPAAAPVRGEPPDRWTRPGGCPEPGDGCLTPVDCTDATQ